MRTCLDCAVDISMRGSAAKRCKNCAVEHKTARDREQNRSWRIANPEKVRERARSWYIANLEKARAQARSWRIANPEKVRARARRWRIANLEKARARDRRWRIANLEKVREQDRSWRIANPEKARAQDRSWRIANPEKVREQTRRHRARKLNQLGAVSIDIESTLLAKQMNRCAAMWCRTRLVKWHLDHIVPLALGGLHDDANLQILCASCNLKKNAQHPDEWQTEHGFLPLLEGASA